MRELLSNGTSGRSVSLVVAAGAWLVALIATVVVAAAFDVDWLVPVIIALFCGLATIYAGVRDAAVVATVVFALYLIVYLAG